MVISKNEDAYGLKKSNIVSKQQKQRTEGSSTREQWLPQEMAELALSLATIEESTLSEVSSPGSNRLQ